VTRACCLSRRLREVGVEVVGEPKLPPVGFKIPDVGGALGFLWIRRLYVYPLPFPGALRVVVRPYVTYEVIDRLANTLEEVLKALRCEPGYCVSSRSCRSFHSYVV
jgi:glutamate/tyrosine decarboxylase-like PLP-dependent enzyme